MFCELPKNYKPLEAEAFMNVRQKEYFRRKLIAWRDELLQHAYDTYDHLKTEHLHEADDVDNAALEEKIHTELIMRDRESRLLVEIEEALERLEQGTYGYCEETGEAINLKRLEACLLTTHCVEVEERFEKEAKLYHH